jgi:hypothetical protein
MERNIAIVEWAEIFWVHEHGNGEMTKFPGKKNEN